MKLKATGAENTIIQVRETYKCPVCKWETDGSGLLVVTIPPYQGKYCMKCWAKWMSVNLPQVKPIKK